MSPSAYAKACSIEKRGTPAVFKFLKWKYDKVVKITGKRRQTFGDYYIELNGKDYAIEVKHETKNIHKNLFIETWSNRHRKQGWLYMSKANILLYHFIEDGEIYMIPIGALRNWAYKPGHLDAYEEKEQVKYEQKNITCGRPVPIDILIKEAGMRKYIMGEDGNWQGELF